MLQHRTGGAQAPVINVQNILGDKRYNSMIIVRWVFSLAPGYAGSADTQRMLHTILYV